ncbi:MAG: DUF86 domain-containing protein [Candidatus Gastranaerophilales bacterium]|nr:DUF86 domain-containing protein [Candidatus Gastranaerophilales bacterium]
MRKRHYRYFLEDILEYSKVAQDLVQNLSVQEFESNLTIFLATTRALEIVGEAIGNIPDEVQKKYPKIPWHEIKGFRNTVVHEYFGIDKEIVWASAKNDTIFLIEQISLILKEVGTEEE